MAKKTLNPADAYRKAQRKKELKKNKTERAKTRDFALVKKDTSELEEEIEKLEEEAQVSGKANPRLAELKVDLEKINAKKAEYVEEHPEARRLVYKSRRKDGDKVEEEKPVPASRNMFNRKGLPRHPERSIYYDPVMNPYGVPPPGMPYMERPLLPGEADSDVEMGDDDDEIPLPPGPPPGFEDVVEDIPLPAGPPPGTEGTSEASSDPPLPPGPPPPRSFFNPTLAHPEGLPHNMNPFIAGFPPPPPGFPSLTMSGLPPPPPGMPPPPKGFPPNMMGVMPPPPNFSPNFPPPGIPFNSRLPLPPPGFFPRKSQTASSLQDPLSSIPHQTYQAHRANQQLPSTPPSLPSKPIASSVTASATIEVAPELRDFKREATAFVPAALKRKKAPTVARLPVINAAPSIGDPGPDKTPGCNMDSGPTRPDLVSALKSQFPMPIPKHETKPRDDYTKFVEDILGPS